MLSFGAPPPPAASPLAAAVVPAAAATAGVEGSVASSSASAAAVRDSSSAADDEHAIKDCVVFLDNPRTHVLIPCGHLCVCAPWCVAPVFLLIPACLVFL